MISIQPQYLTLSKLLDGRLFRIPEYQRAYSWRKSERQDLFSDIRKLQGKGADAGHFMAAIVCLRRDRKRLGTDEFHVVEVVDGQQRLTTLIVLLNAIKLALDADSKKDEKLHRELSELLVKSEADELLLLQTNHDTSHHFANFLRSGRADDPTTAATIADKEILSAISECNEFVQKWLATAELSELAALLKNQLHFLLHEIDDEAAVYTVFEVLNSRGLEVSWIDRLKSILMGAAFELKSVDNSRIIRDLHNSWKQVYAVIGLRQGLSTEALRFAATLRLTAMPSKPLSESDSVETLRQDARTAKKIAETADWMREVATACDRVLSSKRLSAVTRIVQARMLAVAIHLRADIAGAEVSALLDAWEKVSFRIYGMLGKDARTGVGDYVRLAWRVVNEKLPAKSIRSEILAIGHEYGIDDAVAQLRQRNCYEGWETELRYVFYRYEEYLAKEQKQKFRNEQWEKIWHASPSDSIEHIWARSQAPEDCKHWLGNLLILPPRLNSQLQDRPPQKKTDAYRNTGLLAALAAAERINAGRWTKKSIVEREDEILEWAATEWAD